MNSETDFKINSAPDLMCALKAVSDIGQRVIDEVSSFADTILQLAERQDELKVAIADKDRAVAEVSIPPVTNGINRTFENHVNL